MATADAPAKIGQFPSRHSWRRRFSSSDLIGLGAAAAPVHLLRQDANSHRRCRRGASPPGCLSILRARTAAEQGYPASVSPGRFCRGRVFTSLALPPRAGCRVRPWVRELWMDGVLRVMDGWLHGFASPLWPCVPLWPCLLRRNLIKQLKQNKPHTLGTRER